MLVKIGDAKNIALQIGKLPNKNTVFQPLGGDEFHVPPILGLDLIPTILLIRNGQEIN